MKKMIALAVLAFALAAGTATAIMSVQPQHADATCPKCAAPGGFSEPAAEKRTSGLAKPRGRAFDGRAFHGRAFCVVDCRLQISPVALRVALYHPRAAADHELAGALLRNRGREPGAEKADRSMRDLPSFAQAK